jgi:nicotinamide mononucleotide transporter
MFRLLDVNNVAFTIMGYPMSYVELFGTLFYLCSVWLIARRRMLTWPVGIVSVLLYAALFYQIRLYSDALEQVYYLAASIYGWWHWSKSRRAIDKAVVGVRYSSVQGIIWGLGITAVFSIALGVFMSRAHVLLPTLFPEKASYPLIDALTTVMSFTAMWLLARRRIESWLYWIIVDVIGIWLYYVKEVKFIALLYVILLGMAINGLVSWMRAGKARP